MDGWVMMGMGVGMGSGKHGMAWMDGWNGVC